MRLIKMFGLSAIAAVAAMAFIGASSASATSTALCKVHTEPCPAGSLVKSLHMVNTAGTVGELLNNIANVLCLNVLGQATVGALGAPQKLASTALTFTSCGTSAAHNNCTIETTEQPEFTLLKTALNLGSLTAIGDAGKAKEGDKGGITNVKCTILGFIKINCNYDGSGLNFTVEGALHKGSTTGHGMLTAVKTPVTLVSGSNCPTESTLDGLLEPLEHTYIVG